MDNNILTIAIYVVLIALLLGVFLFIQKKRKQVKNEGSSVAAFNKKIQDILNKLDTPEEKISALEYTLDKIESHQEYNRNRAWRNSLMVTIYLHMTLSYNDMGDDSRLMETYDKILELNPKHSLTYYNRGYLYFQQHNNEQALADFEKFLSLDKKDKWGFREEVKGSIHKIQKS